MDGGFAFGYPAYGVESKGDRLAAMIELFVTNALKSLIFPPGGLWLLLLLGLLFLTRHPRVARPMLWCVLLVGYLISTPLVSGILSRSLQDYPALTAEAIQTSPAQAIVVLSAGRYLNAPEYAGDTVGDHSLVRIRYGAYLHRQTGLPILVTGGHVLNREGESLAAVMARALSEEFAVHTVWQEDQSRTTAENARLSQKILAERGIDTVFLVSHAEHMPRAVTVFQQAGLQVIPAPTKFSVSSGHWAFSLLPSASAIIYSKSAIHEWVGRFWYAIRH